jgi:hypothetical protein
MTARSDVPREDSWIDLVLQQNGLLEPQGESEMVLQRAVVVCVLSSFERTGVPGAL